MSRRRIDFYDKAIYFQYSEVLNPNLETSLYCLSPTTAFLAYNLVKHYGGWRGRYVVDTATRIMLGLTEAEWIVVNDLYQVALEELKDASMPISGLENGLNAIADAIRASACCDGPGGSGSGGAGSEPEAPTVNTDDGVNVPPGFDVTYQEYLDYKCNVANWIVDEMLDSLDDLLSFSWGSFGALTIAAAVTAFIAVSGIAIPATLIFVTFGALLGYTGSQASLVSAVKASLTAARDDLVCAIYEAGDVQTALADYKAVAVEAVSGAAVDTVAEHIAVLIVDMYITPDLFNRVFSADVSQLYPTGSTDCSVCGQQTGLGVYFNYANNGTDERGVGPIDISGVTHTLTSFLDSNNFHYIQLGIYDDDVQPTRPSHVGNCNNVPAGLCGTGDEEFRFRVVALNRSQDSGTHITGCLNCQLDNTVTNGGQLVIGQDYGATGVSFISNQAFTMDVQIEYNPA